jgi:ElaB/YqjD/DUF883 family membrane-anchored ribosome-binding protein
MAAAAKTPKSDADPETIPSADLEADIRQLREDIAKLKEQLAETGSHSYGTARRAAAEGVEHLRAQGEAALDGLKSNARDIEEQVLATVREKPVTSLAIAAGVGYLLALLSRR